MKPKKWKKPKLVVLYRGQPEEAVLQICKSDIQDVAVGPNYYNRRCHRVLGWVIQPCRVTVDS